MREDHAELERQIGCVCGLLHKLCEARAKGSITVHLDGGGNIGKTFGMNLTEWRDNYLPVKVGRQIKEEELSRLLKTQS